MAFSHRPEKNDAASPAAPRSLYDQDLYAWSEEQARLLRAGRLDEIDAENIAEEILEVGRNEYDKLESALRVLLAHMLKWDYQPEKRTRSWQATIAIQRLHAKHQFEDNPSLKSRRNKAIERAYARARHTAAAETGLRLEYFPEACPYDWNTITTRPFEYEPRA